MWSADMLGIPEIWNDLSGLCKGETEVAIYISMAFLIANLLPLKTYTLSTYKGGRNGRDRHLVQGPMKPKPERKGEKFKNRRIRGLRQKFSSIIR